MHHFFRHFLLPHHTNNFKARLLHADILAAYVVCLFLFSFVMRVGHHIDPNLLGFATDIHVDRLLSLTNEKRMSEGKGTLRLDPLLSQAAAQKAADMFKDGYWAHNGPDGETPWDFINRSGYVYKVAGENLAKNFSDSSGVIEAWLNSPSHRENLLRSDYQDIGFAVVNGNLAGEETTLVVQMFGTKLAQTPTETAAVDVSNGFELPVSQAIAEERTAIQTAPDVAALEASVEDSSQKAVETPPAQPSEVYTLSEGVVRNPLLDIGSVSKNFMIGLSMFLLMLLIVDGIYIWQKKVVRFSGRTSAHFIFLLAITGIVWIISFGTII